MQIVLDFVPPKAAVAQVNYDTQIQQYQQLLQSRADAVLQSRTRVATEIVQRAVLPEQATAAPRMLLTVAGGVVGALLGLLATVVVARFSQKLIDDQQTSTLLGHDVVGSIGRTPACWPPVRRTS
ncbi:MAG: hypothetical protein R2715_20645 [Ilumatobacteraceae bacterium]